MRRFIDRTLSELRLALSKVATNDHYDLVVLVQLAMMAAERRRDASDTGWPVVNPTVREVVARAETFLKRGGYRLVRGDRGAASVARLVFRKRAKYLDPTPELDAIRRIGTAWSLRSLYLAHRHMRRSPDLRVEFISGPAF